MLAASIPLSLAATNIAKLLALLASLMVLAAAIRRRQPDEALARLKSVPAVLLMLAAMALCLAWTTEPGPQALGDVVKYSKLLLIPAIALLVRTPGQALLAVGIYIASQTFVVATSWLLYLGAPVFWVPAVRNSVATVYSSYLDQTIMTAGFAAICWHLRHDFPGRHGAWAGAALAVAGLVNALVMLPGRSGHVAAIGVMSLAMLWAMPRRWRLAGLAAPVVLVAAARTRSTRCGERQSAVEGERLAHGERRVTGQRPRLFIGPAPDFLGPFAGSDCRAATERIWRWQLEPRVHPAVAGGRRQGGGGYAAGAQPAPGVPAVGRAPGRGRHRTVAGLHGAAGA